MTIGSVKIKGPGRTSIVYPGYAPKVNVSVNDINGFSAVGVENGYTFVYNSITQNFEAAPVSNLDLQIVNITGGLF